MTDSSDEAEARSPRPVRSFFRPEALEYHARERGLGEVLRISPAWGPSAFAALLALVALGVVASAFVEIGDYAAGPARVQSDGTTVVAVLPASARPAMERSPRMELRPRSGGQPAVPVRAERLQPVDTVTAAQMFGTDALGDLLAPSTPLMLVQGTVDGTAATRGEGVGQAVVQVSSRSLLVTLLSGIDPQS